MRGTTQGGTLALALAVVATAGCSGSSHPTARSTTTSPTPSASLVRPLYPKCGTKGFGKPRVKATTGLGTTGRAWQLLYVASARISMPLPPGATTHMVVVEQSPALVRGRVKGGREVNIAGRSVSLLYPSGRFQNFLAQWKTARARYLVFANGSTPATLSRLIGCLP
jgi:hypothetical protein